MTDFHCLDIEFPDIDFDSYYIKTKVKVSKVHHVHLYAEKDKIELRFLYDERTYFGEKLMTWSNKIDGRKFGSFMKVVTTKNHNNERLQKVDLSEAKLVGASNSTDYYENGKKYVIVKINTAKYYWDPIEQEKFTAEFYLDDKGFRIVKSFYSFLSSKSFFNNEGKFEIRRMKDANRFFKLGKSQFRPEYYFVSNDDRENRIATITKKPKLQFKYQKGITEKEAFFYGDVILMLASFYYHLKIDYVLRRVHLTGSTIIVKNLEQKNFVENSGNLYGFNIHWDFNKLLSSSWQKDTIKNYELLSKVISLFNQSHLVDSNSAFLIRYNIIEICDKIKQEKVKFTLALNKNQTNKKYEEALSKLLETISIDEREEFKKRWHNVQTLLQNKPMKNQLVAFLESQNLDTKSFPIKIDDLKKLRDNITHGSIDKVSKDQLRKANILLYRIAGILILNLIGIKNWKLKTELT